MELKFLKSNRIQILNGEIIFKNFRGKANDYNRSGAMKFSVVIDEQYVEHLKNDGWNVKLYTPRDEKYDPFYYLEMELRYNHVPPKVFSVLKDKIQELNEDTVGELDYVDISHGDMIINGSKYDVNGRQGTKAYVNKLYVALNADILDEMYGSLSESDFMSHENDDDQTEDDIPF